MLRPNFLLVCLTLPLVFVACGKQEAKVAAAAPAKVEQVVMPRAEADSPRLAAVQKAIDAYAVVRTALATDDLAAAQKSATELSIQARAAAGQLSGPAADHLTQLAATAEKLTVAPEIESARDVFGDLSKTLIQAVSLEPSFQTGLVTYQCPMARGYQKWVQTGDDMANPYMGQRMLKCGSKVKLEP
jgi:hypothetical protein